MASAVLLRSPCENHYVKICLGISSFACISSILQHSGAFGVFQGSSAAPSTYMTKTRSQLAQISQNFDVRRIPRKFQLPVVLRINGEVQATPGPSQPREVGYIGPQLLSRPPATKYMPHEAGPQLRTKAHRPPTNPNMRFMGWNSRQLWPDQQNQWNFPALNDLAALEYR